MSPEEYHRSRKELALKLLFGVVMGLLIVTTMHVIVHFVVKFW